MSLQKKCVLLAELEGATGAQPQQTGMCGALIRKRIVILMQFYSDCTVQREYD